MKSDKDDVELLNNETGMEIMPTSQPFEVHISAFINIDIQRTSKMQI